MSRKIITVIIFIIGFSVILYCILKPTDKLQKIRIGYVPGPLISPFYMTYKYGFFEQEGLDVELKKMLGPDIPPAIIGGSLDGGTIGSTVLIYAAQQDLPIIAVATLGYCSPDAPCRGIIIRKGINIMKPNDFKGKTLCVDAFGSMSDMFFKVFLKTNGIDYEKDVTYIEIPKTKQSVAFASGSVDASLIVDPFKSKIVNDGLANLYRVVDWLPPQFANAPFVFSKEFIKKNPDLVRRFARAYLKGVHYELTHEKEKKETMSEYTGLSINVINMMDLPVTDKKPIVKTDILNQLQDLMYQYGMINEKVYIGQYIDNSFIEEAYKEFGL